MISHVVDEYTKVKENMCIECKQHMWKNRMLVNAWQMNMATVFLWRQIDEQMVARTNIIL